jgi:hypothetical protein
LCCALRRNMPSQSEASCTEQNKKEMHEIWQWIERIPLMDVLDAFCILKLTILIRVLVDIM